MATKTINTRIQTKIDTEANWAKATNFKPLKGEVIIYDKDASHTEYRYKIGDGKTLVNALPFSKEPIATKDVAGLVKSVKTGETAGRYYNVEVNTDGTMKVNVPWTDNNSHYTTGAYVGAANVKSNAATTNGNTYLKVYDDNTKRAEFKIKGSGATTVTSDASGNITINSTDTNTHQTVTDKNPTLAWGTKAAVATIGSTDIHVTMPANPNSHQSIKTLDTTATTAQATNASEAIAGSGKITLHKVAKTGNYNDLLNKPTIPTIPTNYVTTNTNQTVTGTKTWNAPTDVSDTEVATAVFKTSNGGKIILGKEGPNSGTMIAMDQVAGTRRLNFRASSTPGALVWEQPESDSSLIYDVKGIQFRGVQNVTFANFKNAAALGTDANGALQKVSLAKVATSNKYSDLDGKPTIPDVTGKLDKDTSTAFTLYGTGSIAGDPTRMWPLYRNSSAEITIDTIPTYASTAGGYPALYGRSNQTEDSTKMSVIEDNELPTYKFVKGLLNGDAKLASDNTFTGTNSFNKPMKLDHAGYGMVVGTSITEGPGIVDYTIGALAVNEFDGTPYLFNYKGYCPVVKDGAVPTMDDVINGTYNKEKTAAGMKFYATKDDVQKCVTTSTIELVSYTARVNIETNKVIEIYLDVEGMNPHAWNIITIDPRDAVFGGNEISSSTDFYYNYMGTKTQLTLNSSFVVKSLRSVGYLMQFIIDNSTHKITRSTNIELEKNKNTLFISQARLYFVNDSRNGYQLQLVGPQDLSNYVEKDLINLSSSTSLIKTNRLYIKDSSDAGNKVMTADDVHLYEHRIQLRTLDSTPHSGDRDVIGSLVLYSEYDFVLNSAEALYKVLQQEITYLSGPAVVIRYTDVDNPSASTDPCTTIVHYTDSSDNDCYKFGGYNGASYSGSGGLISVYEDTVRTIR